MRRLRLWLANRLEGWSLDLHDWADRVRPPWVPPPGLPLTQMEQVTRETLGRYRDRWALELTDYQNEQWTDEERAKQTANAKVGETLRIRLPNDYAIGGIDGQGPAVLRDPDAPGGSA